VKPGRFPLWIVLGAVLAATLVIGSGVFDSAPPTPTQRAYSIDSTIRCPSCEDLSAANSSARTAVIVRSFVRQLIAGGKSDRQIRDDLVARYGSTISLVPPTSGWSLLVWLMPLAGGGVAIAALGGLFIRRRRAVYGDPEAWVAGDTESELSVQPYQPDQIDRRRSFLQLSLSDAAAEHRAGDLSDQDYLALRARDSARLDALDALDSPPDMSPDVLDTPSDTPSDTPPGTQTTPTTRPRRNRRQRWLLGGSVTAFGSALVVLVALFAADRLPGQTPSGNPTLGRQGQIEQSLAQAAALVNENQPGEAAQLYQNVLTTEPNNEVALAQLGWIEFQIGRQGNSASLIADARSKLDKAVRLDPGDFAVRLYLGTVLLLQDDNVTGAIAQYDRFLADQPPPTVVAEAAANLRQAYRQAGVPIPSQVPAS
jgi:cytochrome c-type biogenesis protein CcmH